MVGINPKVFAEAAFALPAFQNAATSSAAFTASAPPIVYQYYNSTVPMASYSGQSTPAWFDARLGVKPPAAFRASVTPISTARNSAARDALASIDVGDGSTFITWRNAPALVVNGGMSAVGSPLQTIMSAVTPAAPAAAVSGSVGGTGSTGGPGRTSGGDGGDGDIFNISRHVDWPGEFFVTLRGDADSGRGFVYFDGGKLRVSEKPPAAGAAVPTAIFTRSDGKWLVSGPGQEGASPAPIGDRRADVQIGESAVSFSVDENGALDVHSNYSVVRTRGDGGAEVAIITILMVWADVHLRAGPDGRVVVVNGDARDPRWVTLKGYRHGGWRYITMDRKEYVNFGGMLMLVDGISVVLEAVDATHLKFFRK